MEAESKEAEVQASKPQPVCPYPQPCVVHKKGTTVEVDQSGNQSEAAALMDMLNTTSAQSAGDPDLMVTKVSNTVSAASKPKKMSLRDSLQAWKA